MTPGTLWHVVRVADTGRTLQGDYYVEAPRWFDARNYASRYFAVNRDSVELVVVPDGEAPKLPCRVVRATPKGDLVVSRRRGTAKKLNGAGGNGHE